MPVDLKIEIENYLDRLFKGYDYKSIRSGKIIHDSVWGTENLTAYDVFILNTPLLQRLRRISQTGLAYFTFPSTTHTRFSHSLGVYSQVKRLIEAVEESDINNTIERKNTLKFAALLHDVGHGPFSHISEEIFKNASELREVKQSEKDLYNNPKGHEVLSYLIVKSEFFRTSILQNLSKLHKQAINIDQELLGNCIVGNSSDKQKAFEIEFINGAFDADKLDYLMRDGLYSGLPLRIDLDRLWHSVDILQTDFKYGNETINAKRLTIKPNAVSLMEQLVFAKMLLFMNFYHHQKIRATECLFKGIIEYIQDNDLRISLKSMGKEIGFTNPVDFLYLDDPFFMSGYLKELFDDPKLHRLIDNLQRRNHFVRAAVISYDTITPDYKTRSAGPEVNIAFKQLLDLGGSQVGIRISEQETRKLAGRIHQGVQKKHPECLKEEIWLDIPGLPSFDESELTFVSPYTKDSEPMSFNNFFPSKMWAEQYRTHKFKINVFCPREFVEETSRITRNVLKDEFNLTLNKLAFEICHQKVPVD